MPALKLSSLTPKSIVRSMGTWVHDHPDGWLNMLGAIIGVLTAVGAIGFAYFLELVLEWTEHLQHQIQGADGSRIYLMPLIPMAGALISGVLVYLFAREAAGHGVPQVLDAIVRRGGKLRARVGVVKIITSICTVGTGGSAGAEGPIVQIGSVIGSTIGQRLAVPSRHVPTLVGCGAAAGISSIFNAPIAGVFFALEILLRDFSLKAFTPIVIASVFATAMTQVLLPHEEAIFAYEITGYLFTVSELPSYLLLGFVCAIAAWMFVEALHASESVFEKVPLHPALLPVLGALVLGVLGIVGQLGSNTIGENALVPTDSSVPVFFGNGYAMITSLLDPTHYTASDVTWAAVVTLGLLMLAKIAATSATLGSGGSGGVFAPSLFVGATVGGTFGLVLEKLGFIPEGGSPASYALVGMAAVVAGTTFAPMTAILMLFELTREPRVLAPIMLAAIISTMFARMFMPDSIYTAKLRRAGIRIGTGRDLSLLRHVPVSSVSYASLPPEPVYASDPLSKLITLHAHHNVPDFPVVDSDGRYMGMVTGADMRTALIDREAIPLLLVAELMRNDLPIIKPDEHLDTVMEKFAGNEVSSLVLVDGFEGTKPLALVTRAKVMHRYNQVLDEA
ncbi:MAG: chloride channel protein [Phycisphaerales bacterium]|nr:chloride channel protein [Phycisphaerales bacterium]